MEFKKCQKAELTIKKSKLMDACLNGNGDLFKEIKAMRKTRPRVADSIDGATEDLSGHFSNIYSELYNCVDDGEEVKNICAPFSLAQITTSAEGSKKYHCIIPAP